MQHNSKFLDDPDSYLDEIKIRIGKKFLLVDPSTVPEKAFIELGEHFIRIVNGEKTHFSQPLKQTLYRLLGKKQPPMTCSFSFGSNIELTDPMRIDAIKEEEDRLEETFLGFMTINSSSTIGFQQLKIISEVAQEVKSPSDISEADKSKRINKIFLGLHSNDQEKIHRLIKETIEELAEANALLFARAITEFTPSNKKRQSSK